MYHSVSKKDSHKFQVFTNMKDYQLDHQVGEGTYGKVFKAVFKPTGHKVALKKIFLKEDSEGKQKNRDAVFLLTSFLLLHCGRLNYCAVSHIAMSFD
jgi:serine/threonine protein kinase